MADPIRMLRLAEKNLNEAHQVYSGSALRSEFAKEFDELKLQACIFQYEVCSEMYSLISNKPDGFSQQVAVKGLIQHLFEYHLVSAHLTKRIQSLAKMRGITLSDENLISERKKWKVQFQKLSSWGKIRNKAIGHYDKDTVTQFAALEAIDPGQVMEVSMAFYSFNMELLKMLRLVGRGHST